MFTRLSCGHVVSVELTRMAGGCPECMMARDLKECPDIIRGAYDHEQELYPSDQDLSELAGELNDEDAHLALMEEMGKAFSEMDTGLEFIVGDEEDL